MSQPTRFNPTNVVGVIVFLVAAAAVLFRTHHDYLLPGDKLASGSESSFSNFHDEVYFPVRAFLTGVSPYDESYLDYHPDGKQFPVLAPSSLLVHVCLGFFSLQFSEYLFAGVSLLLLLATIWISINACRSTRIGEACLLAALVLVCSPGMSLFYGWGISLTVIFGIVLALRFSDSEPLISGLGILLAFCSPTAGIVLAVLMLVRGNLSAVSIGCMACLLANAIAVVVIANHDGGVKNVVADIQNQYESLENYPVVGAPSNDFERTDTSWASSQWFGKESTQAVATWIPIGIVVLIAVVLLLERNLNYRFGLHNRTSLLIILAITTAFYRSTGESVLFCVPLLGFIYGSVDYERGLGQGLRFALAFLIVVPLINYFATTHGIAYFGIEAPANFQSLANGDASKITEFWQWKLFSTVNSIALAIAVVLVCGRVLLSPLLSADHRELIESA